MAEYGQQVAKALNAETRIDLLNELGRHGKTPTYLANQVGKHKSTVVEHLSILQDAGLVDRHSEPGKKRVTYTLTPQGRKVAAGKRRTAIITGSLGAAITGAGTLIWSRLAQTAGTAAQFDATTMQAPEAAHMPAETASAIDPLVAAGATLLLIGLAGTAYWYRTR